MGTRSREVQDQSPGRSPGASACSAIIVGVNKRFRLVGVCHVADGRRLSYDNAVEAMKLAASSCRVQIIRACKPF